MLDKGTVIALRVRIDPEETTICTIRAIEQDEDIPGLYYYYLCANEEVLNDKIDPKIGMYFEFVEANSDRIIVLSKPTLN